MSLLARFFPRRLALELAECRGELLTAERRAVHLVEQLDFSQHHFLLASRRADAMTTERDRLLVERAQVEAVLAQALEEAALSAHMLENLTVIADGLRNELKAAKARKGKR